MSDEMDKALNNIDRRTRVAELLRSYGASETQAAVGASYLMDKFTWTGTALNFNATGLNAVDDPACKEHITKEYAFLLPPPNAADNTDNESRVDPTVLALARTGNKTAQGKVFLALGKDRAATDALIAKKPDAAAATSAQDDDATKKNTGAPKHRNNPWHQSNFNISAQGKLLRAVGPEKAAAIARAVGCTIGSTKPNLNY